MTDFAHRSFVRLLFKAAVLLSLQTVCGRRERAGCASQHCWHRLLLQKALLGRGGDLEAAGLAEAKPANLRSPACERIPLSPFLLRLCYQTVTYTDFGAHSTSFYCHHLLLWAAQPTSLLLWLFQHHFGNLNAKSMTVLLQSSDPAGRYCGYSYRHYWEQ